MKQKKLWKSLLTVFVCFTLMLPLFVNAADCDGKEGVTSDDARWILMKVAGKI